MKQFLTPDGVQVQTSEQGTRQWLTSNGTLFEEYAPPRKRRSSYILEP